MKTMFLFGLALAIPLVITAQNAQLKQSVNVKKYGMISNPANQPERTGGAEVQIRPTGITDKMSPGAVTVLNLGTSADLNSYSGGTRTMLWADDDLNCVVNFHRMGPGGSPPGLSGYLGMDIGLNMGLTQSDWTNQVQIQASTLASSPYYYDAGFFPSAAIFNPAGNIALECAYLAWFAPTYSNLSFSGLGGYSFGRANLGDHSDTTKHLRWYNPPPHSFVPDGFTVARNGIAHMVDLDIKQVGGAEVYQDSVIYGRGVWNNDTKDFDYTFSTLAFPCKEAHSAADVKIAASPDGNDVWISVLTNFAEEFPGMNPLIDSTYYPLVRHSPDGGLTWSSPIPVYLDGPNGITGVKNTYSDYFIMNFFIGPPWPSRDEIPYTTAFDHTLTVGLHGEIHIGVAIGYAPGAYQVASGIDSLMNVYDIFSVDDGMTWDGVWLGALKTFRGIWGNYSCDNRVYISRNKACDRIFVTWNDTRIPGVTENQFPDVYARGLNCYSRLTSLNGLNEPHNVTAQTSIAGEAYWQCTAPLVFTDDNKYTIPICTQWFSDPDADSRYKYISDFFFTDNDFTILTPDFLFWGPCLVGIDQENGENEPVTIYPNPANDIINVSLNSGDCENVSVEVVNMFGQKVMAQNIVCLGQANREFILDVSRLSPGVYFLRISFNGQKLTRKLVVN